MKVIYKPQGRAKEYAGLALNVYMGCTHACLYCYAPGAAHKTREDYIAEAQPRKNIIERLEKDCQELISFEIDGLMGLKKHEPIPYIHMSFLGDMYQPADDDLQLTRQAIKTLIKYDLPFQILTKGGSRAKRDFDLLEGYDKCKFGTTLIFASQTFADKWEPNTASIADRIDTIIEARNRGIKTWVSVEPVVDPEQALSLIDFISPWVDEFKVGKINYNKEIEEKVDWIKFRKNVTNLLKRIGAKYYLKNSLTKL